MGPVSPNEEKRFQLSFDPFVLTTGNFQPGTAEDYCRTTEDAVRGNFGLAELTYYRGDPDAAFDQFEAIRHAEEGFASVGAFLCRTLSALAAGNVYDVIETYRLAKDLHDAFDPEHPFKKMSDFFLLYFNIIVNNVPAIDFPAYGISAFSVPESLKPMAFYIYTNYLIETGDVGRAVGMAEGALLFMKKPAPVSEIYLSLVICSAYMARQNWEKAEYYFRYAWSLAKPDHLVMPFAEMRGKLYGMLEKCLRYEEPAAYKEISDLANRYHKSWVFIHNALTGERLADNLTAIEYNIASLACRNMTNQEIADFSGITVNSVRAHLRNIFNKLNVGCRKDLIKFVI